MLLPLEWNFENYRAMIFDKPLLIWLRSSLHVASLTTIISLLISTSAAYAFSHARFCGAWPL